MDNEQKEASERREFFRIECLADVELSPVQGAEKPADTFFTLPPTLQLLLQLSDTGRESQQVLQQITEQNKSVGNYLKMLNHKIDLLASTMVSSTLDEEAYQTIDISEGGLKLEWDTPLPKDQLLATKIILLPDLLLLTLYTKVLQCETENKKYKLHLEYQNIDLADQQRLSRYIITQQRRQIKKR